MSLSRRAACVLTALASCAPSGPSGGPTTPGVVSGPPGIPRDAKEVHLGEIRQLTFGGENAEAYWSNDGTQLILQSTRPPYACDQIFRVDAFSPGAGPPEAKLVSDGTGRTTCAYFLPGDQRVLYASTHLAGKECPPKPDHSKGYVWPLYDSFDIFSAKPDGSELTRLTTEDAYDAEATVCPLDGSIVFTSTRDGDLDLYRMDADGKNVKRLTSTPGYDGGAFFSRDCKQIVWRASRPQPGPELEEYQALLREKLVKPSKLEIFVADADGENVRQVTYLGAASFAPYFFPDGKRILFSSNFGDPKGREFDIWAVDVNGANLERITWQPGFDGFPMFSPDGKHLAFSSNRHQGAACKGLEGDALRTCEREHSHDTDVYVAEWIPDAKPVVSEARGPDRVLADVAWLADDARAGRGVGGKGLEVSTDYLARRFAAVGLAPGAPDYRHAFEAITQVTVGPTTALKIDGVPAAAGDFTPAGFSLSGAAAGEVVVAGFGISAPEIGHDDYKKLNVKDKIVVVRRFVPDGEKWKDDKLARRYGEIRYKAFNAREHGAKALIVVDLAVGKKQPDETPLPRLQADQQGDAGIPVVVVRRAVGGGLFDGKRHVLELTIALEHVRTPVYNVVGTIAAGAPDKLPGVVVIGAHYDHLGLGGPGSLAPDSKDPHNGADDNASGTAALVEVGRELVARKSELRRDVWLVAFSAEELGVLGSSAFVRNPPAGLAIKDVVAMLNMDMVGRLRSNRLSVLGGESADEWPSIVNAECGKRRIECTVSGTGYGPSDHTPFFAAGVPVLHFFTGAHADYHKPSDDVDAINVAGLAEVALLVADVARAVAAREKLLTLKKTAAPPGMGDRRSGGASLGTVPDYAGPPGGKPGVLLAGVRPGSAAEKAGIQRGDVLVGINGTEIRNIEDFMFMLQKAKPGDKGVVAVERDGKRLELDVVWGKSAR